MGTVSENASVAVTWVPESLHLEVDLKKATPKSGAEWR